MTANNFLVIDTCYGKLIVARHGHYMDQIIRSGQPHIDSDLQRIFSVIDGIANCVFLDAGANIGLFTMPVAIRILPHNGEVIAFEPQRPLFYALAGTIALNNLYNVQLYNEGLSDKLTEMYVTQFDYGVYTDFGMGKLAEHGQGEKVIVSTIDSLNLPRLDFIKIDVESMELQVLTGGRDTIRKYRPAMWIEYVHCGGKEKILQHLHDMGLNYKIVDEDSMNILIRGD